MARISLLSLLVSSVALAATVIPAYDNSVYLIRHGEKPTDGSRGMTPEGKQRALCLVDVLGSESAYNIGYIISQGLKPDGTGERSYDTVKPLSEALGLPIDASCERSDNKCVAKLVQAFAATSNKGVLICWAHSKLGKIAGALGVRHPPVYPEDFHWIWTVQHRKMVSNATSERCPGLDDTYHRLP